MKNTTSIDIYIASKYKYWLKYSQYYCELCGIGDEYEDVLNEVLLSLLQKPEEKVNHLLSSKKGQYTELYFYVLRMIKLNASSQTSPYQNKYKAIPFDSSINYTELEISDVPYDDELENEYLIDRIHKIRDIINRIGLSEKQIALLEFRFFQSGEFKDWKGTESIKELYDQYSKIMDVIKRKIKGELIL